MFNHIPDHSLLAGMDITHPKPDFPAANDSSAPAKTAVSAGLPDTFSFEDFLSQRRESEQLQDRAQVSQHRGQDGAEVLNNLKSDDDAANVNQIRSILEQLLVNLCDIIIRADLLSNSDLADILLFENVITAELYNTLSKSLKICDQRTQNEQIDSSSLEILYSLFPYLYNQLTEIYLKKRSLFITTCPRCGYVSETEESVCPKCGYVF